MKKLGMLGIIGGAALLTAAPLSLQWSQKNVTLSLDSAQARIGRPLTATSIAGVHRRVHRRAYRRAVYAGAVAAGVGAYGYGSYYGYSSPAYSGYVPYGYSYAAPYGSYSSSYATPGYGYAAPYSYYGPSSYYRRPFSGFSPAGIPY
jgi:hypothetical protein